MKSNYDVLKRRLTEMSKKSYVETFLWDMRTYRHRKIDFTVNSGDYLCILGENGSERAHL